METLDQNKFDEPAAKKRWSLTKIGLSLLIVLGVFGAGVAVGRQQLDFGGLRQSSNKSLPLKLDYSSVNQVYDLLKADFDGQLDQSKLLDGLKNGLVTSTGDPYTEYFNPKDAKAFNDALAGNFTGIGAELGTDSDNHIVVVAPLAGFPAEKAGLRSKDIIAAINGQNTSDLSLSATVQKIRGPAGSKVTLTVVRGADKPFEVTITRAQINVPSVKSQVDGSIGYLKINQFSNDTVDLTQKAAADFKAKGVKAIVLDLRGDPGGYVSSAVDVCSLWLNSGQTVVSERRGSITLKTETASGKNLFKGLPTVVLIDSGSASASEITAGALRDNGLATIVGTKSFGKGSVQQVDNLPGGGELKVTIARWYTPNGKNIDKQGITPDIMVNISEDDQKAGRDPQKDQAYQILRGKI